MSLSGLIVIQQRWSNKRNLVVYYESESKQVFLLPRHCGEHGTYIVHIECGVVGCCIGLQRIHPSGANEIIQPTGLDSGAMFLARYCTVLKFKFKFNLQM